MRKNKLLLLLALLLTAATGAWAQTETLLLTIENKDYTTFTSGSMSFDDKVTVTFSKTVYNEGDTYGWYAATESLLTVAGTNGYNITSCKFYTNDGTANTGYTIAGESPSVYLFGGGVYTDANQSEYLGDPGITKIEVYTAATGYTVSMKDGVKDAGKWTVKVGDGEAQALPIGGLKGDGSETVTLQYTGRMKVKGVKATSEAAPTGKTVDLSTLTADYEAQDGETLTGTLANNVKISIADGATVTLKDVNITNLGENCDWAGINCPGNATLVLEGTNTVCAGRDGSDYNNYPGIWIAPDKTLTIQGAGTLTAYSNGTNPFGAGIGGGYQIDCGNIVINGGNITATGGNDAAGIGGCNEASCGNITISGGTVEAIGGGGGAGIGGGDYASCGNIEINGGTITATGGDCAAGIGGGNNNGACGTITITSGVTSVTATKGEYAPNSIGSGDNGTAITVTIGGVEGAITTSPYTYDPTAQAKPAATVTTAPTGAAIVGVGKTTALVSGGAAEGGTLMYQMTTENTMPTTTDGFSEAVPTAQTITASGKVYVWYYVKGDDTHSDSEIAATAIEVPVADVVWDATNLSDLYVSGTYASSTIEGITLSGNADQMSAMWNGYGDPTHDGIAFNMNESGGYTFTAPNGKAFTKIVMKPQGQGGWDMANLGTGWTFNADYNEDIEEYIFTVTWKGNAAASTVVLLKDADMFAGETISYIVFYLSDAE